MRFLVLVQICWPSPAAQEETADNSYQRFASPDASFSVTARVLNRIIHNLLLLSLLVASEMNEFQN
jgi:hypothetical protein